MGKYGRRVKDLAGRQKRGKELFYEVLTQSRNQVLQIFLHSYGKKFTVLQHLLRKTRL